MEADPLGQLVVADHDRATDDVAHQRARARALSPLATLERGYAVVQDAGGAVIASVAGVADGASLSIRVADGRIAATATSTTSSRGPDRPDRIENTDG